MASNLVRPFIDYTAGSHGAMFKVPCLSLACDPSHAGRIEHEENKLSSENSTEYTPTFRICRMAKESPALLIHRWPATPKPRQLISDVQSYHVTFWQVWRAMLRNSMYRQGVSTTALQPEESGNMAIASGFGSAISTHTALATYSRQR